MNLDVDVERLQLARKSLRADLLAERAPDGHWTGELASSPLATAAAISALVVAHSREARNVLQDATGASGGESVEQIVQCDLCELFVESLHWLAKQQNADGGWGDCPGAPSNIASTLLVQAAFRLTGIPAKYADLMVRADDYVEAQGGVSALRKQVGDKMLVAPILANCALAGMIPWRQVSTLRFELVCMPRRWQKRIQLPVPRQAIPTFIAVGQSKLYHDPPRNPLTRLLRRSLQSKSMAILQQLQAADDSYLTSPLTTAFVVMNLASIGCQDHRIVTRGVEFLLTSIRADSSWPLTTNLAVSNTVRSLEIFAPTRDKNLPSNGKGVRTNDRTPYGLSETTAWAETATTDDTAVNSTVPEEHAIDSHDDDDWPTKRSGNADVIYSTSCLDWLLSCQRATGSAITEVGPGGWARSDAQGALPNSFDTAGALIALAHWPRQKSTITELIENAAVTGGEWLLDLQNENGGWPTFYRDGNLIQLDESAVDTTAISLRALVAWRRLLVRARGQQIDTAIQSGIRFLESRQQKDGSFIPTWVGNLYQEGRINPVFGTTQVLSTCRDLSMVESDMARHAARWLLSAQHSTGGWGPPRAPLAYSNDDRDGFRAWRANDTMAKFCSVEETAMAVTALLPFVGVAPEYDQAVSRGVNWLVNSIEQDAHRQAAVLGFYLSKIWYHERLFPLIFAAGALERTAESLGVEQPAVARVS